MSRMDSWHWTFSKWPPQYRTNSTLSDFNNISYVGRMPWHWKISTGRHFQNGHNNTTKNQHFPISSKFDMWVDNDVPNWFPTLKNFYRLPFSKWPPQYRTNSTLSNFNAISYVVRLWCPELIPDIEKFLPVAIFKMATTIPHKFNIVRFQCPELIPDIEQFLPVSIFKMAVTIPEKFNIVRVQR